MHRVLEHIDRHLDERLELESLARVANFSSFHFHRLFAAWMGENVGEYLRRRLEVGALRLAAQPPDQASAPHGADDGNMQHTTTDLNVTLVDRQPVTVGLPDSGMQLDARPFFEYYATDATYDPQTGVYECDICIPVVVL